MICINLLFANRQFQIGQWSQSNTGLPEEDDEADLYRDHTTLTELKSSSKFLLFSWTADQTLDVKKSINMAID